MGKRSLFFSMAAMVMIGAIVIMIPAWPGGFEPHSCARRTVTNAAMCRKWEEKILATTVRIEFQSWQVEDDESGYVLQDAKGHATIMDGRFLVTHNHYNIPLSLFVEEGGAEVYTRASIYTADGQKVMERSLDDFGVALIESQTMVFDVGEEGQEALAAAGLASAQFKCWSSLQLQPGMEVAQVDWDGNTAHVDWITIEAVKLDETTQFIELDNYIKIGASGGSVTWQGYHIANNWARATENDASTEYSREFSMAALNTQNLIEVLVRPCGE